MASPIPKYTPEALQFLFDYYFQITDPKDWTVTGLAISIGSKQLLCDYGRRKQTAQIVALARLRIEEKYEKLLTKSGCSGSIFALNNMGWSTKNEQEISTKDNKPIKFYLPHNGRD